jgi:hypothetical protein
MCVVFFLLLYGARLSESKCAEEKLLGGEQTCDDESSTHRIIFFI